MSKLKSRLGRFLVVLLLANLATGASLPRAAIAGSVLAPSPPTITSPFDGERRGVTPVTSTGIAVTNTSGTSLVTISGSSEPTTRVRLLVLSSTDKVLTTPLDTAAGSDGTWRVGGDFYDGVHSIVAIARYPLLGEWSTQSNRVTFTVDTVAPDTQIKESPGPFSRSPVTFTFSATEPVSRFECLREDTSSTTVQSSFQACGTTYSANEGRVTYSVGTGNQKLMVRAVDFAGNFDPTAAQYEWFSTTSTVTITSPTPGSFVTATTTIAGTAPKNSVLKVYEDGQEKATAVPINGNWSVTYTNISQGVKHATATAYDPANTSKACCAPQYGLTSSEVTFTVDTVTPETTITAHPGPSSGRSVTFEFVSNENAATFDCSLDGVSYSPCVSPATFSVSEGRKVFFVRAKDAAGNQDPTPSFFTWIAFFSQVKIDTPVSGTYMSNPVVHVKGIAPKGSVVGVYDNGALRSYAWSNLLGDWTTAIDLRDGAHVITATAQDLAFSFASQGPYTLNLACCPSAGPITSDPVAFVLDSSAPTVTVASLTTSPTNSSTIRYRVAFSEAVEGFGSEDVVVAGTAFSPGQEPSITASTVEPGRLYDIEVSGMSQTGTLVAQVKPAAVRDQAGNYNGPSPPTDSKVDYDPEAPEIVSIESPTESRANKPVRDEATFTVTFSEGIKNFTADDVTVILDPPTNNHGQVIVTPISAIPDDRPQVYLVKVPDLTGEGRVWISIPANAVQDDAGNSNVNARESDEVTYDVIAPSPSLGSASTYSNSRIVAFSADFREPVLGFDSSDVVLKGNACTREGIDSCQVVVISTTEGDRYALSVVGMLSEGWVALSIRPGAAIDRAGNLSLASNEANVYYDVTPPAFESISEVASNQPGISVQALFSENIDCSKVGADDFLSTVNEEPKQIITATCTDDHVADDHVELLIDASITPTQEDVPVTVALVGDIADRSGNKASKFPDAPVRRTIIKPYHPVPTISGPDYSNTPIVDLQVEFDKPVRDFDQEDVIIGGDACSLSSGEVICRAETNPDVKSGEAQGLPSRGPYFQTYAVRLSGMYQDGPLTIKIRDRAATSTAGVESQESAVKTVTYDPKPPTVTVSSLTTSPTNSSTIGYRVAFSEAVEGFGSDDVFVAGTAFSPGREPSIGVSTVQPKRLYDIAVSGMSQTGTLVAQVKAAAVQDQAGNYNGPSSSTDSRVDYDPGAPEIVSIESPPESKANKPIRDEATFTVTFSEAVKNFTTGDITVILDPPTNSHGQVIVTPILAIPDDRSQVYLVKVPDLTGEGRVSISIPANAVQDGAGNSNVNARESDEVTYDAGKPNPNISRAREFTNSVPITFSVQFGEPVAGFDASDIDVGGTACAGLLTPSANRVRCPVDIVATPDPGSYTIRISKVATEGTITIQVIEGAAYDQAGNLSQASGWSSTTTYDITSPMIKQVTVDNANQNRTKNSPIVFQVEFSEPVLGFDSVEDVSVSSDAGSFSVGAPRAVSETDQKKFSVQVSITTSVTTTVTMQVKGGTAQDHAGNDSKPQSSPTLITLDQTGPVIEKIQATGGSPIVIVTMSEDVVCDQLTNQSFGIKVGDSSSQIQGLECSRQQVDLRSSLAPHGGERVEVSLSDPSKVIDLAQNTAEASSVAADAKNQTPIITITAQARTNQQTVAVSVNASDPDGLVTQSEIYLDGMLVSSQSFNPSGAGVSFVTNVDLGNNVEEATHTITVTAMDDGTERGGKSVAVFHDTIRPVFMSIVPAGTHIDLGTLEVRSRVTARFSEPLQCSSVDRNGTDFLAAINGVPVEVITATCSGDDPNHVDLVLRRITRFQDSIWVTLISGTDGNTVLDRANNSANATTKSMSQTNLF